MRKNLSLLTATLLISLCFVVTAFSQGIETGGITGVVTDQGHALVRGATIDVIDQSTGKSVRRETTGADGGFAATLLSPGGLQIGDQRAKFQERGRRRCPGQDY